MAKVVFLHGFLGRPEDWQPTIQLLDRPCDCYRLPGHGRPALHEMMSLENLAQDFQNYYQDLQSKHDTVVGYSMGGRIALQWSLLYPPKNLVLIGAAPGLTESERPARKISDLEWMNLLDKSPDKFLNKWIQQPLFGPTEKFLARSVSSPRDLKRIFLEASQAENNDLWGHLLGLKCNLVYVSGELDTKYVEIARRIVDVRPSTKVITIPNGYHDVHRTNPKDVAEILRGVL